MISANFYPTDIQIVPDIELTDHLLEIPDFTTSMADAYLMGYIAGNKMPAAFMPNYLTGGAGSMSSLYHPKNTGWGYGLLDSTEDQRWATSFARVNNEVIARPAERNKYRLFNAIKMASANTGMEISILVIFAFIDNAVYDGNGGTVDFVAGGTDAGSWGTPTSLEFTYTFDEFANIIENDLPLFTETRTGTKGVINGKTFTFSPRPSEFGDSNDPNADHKWIVDSGQGAQAVVLIDGYTINAQMAYANGGGSLTNYFLRPFTYSDIDPVNDLPATKAMFFPASLSSMSQRLTWAYNKDTGIFELVPGNTQTYTVADYNINPGGFNFGTITDADADFTSTSLNTRDLLVKKSVWMNANAFGTRTGGNIQNMYTPLDVYRHALLYHKHTTDGTQTSYGDGNTWTTRFNESDTPTDEILTGSYASIAGSLRPWQLPDVDITRNGFTPEDIPEYIPPGPGPGGEPDEGDRGASIPLFGNTPPSTDFLHQAAFPVATIQSLATQLWNQPDNFWQKIVASTSENPMDYFISLRYYPLTFTHGDGKNVLHIGRGGELNLGSNYYPVYPVESFNFGTIAIKRQYNNFLDYAPYTRISIFLPYAGTFELNPTIVMGRTLKLWLDVDCTDGSGVWTVYNQTDSQPVLIKQCRLAAEVPLSGIDASQMAANIINASLQTAQHTLGAAKTDLNSRVGVAGQALSGNLEGALSGAVGSVFNGPQAVLTGLGDAYNLAQASKEIPQYTGGSTGAAACSANNTPYIVYRRPLCTNPANFAHAVGYLSNKTAAILTLSGFTTCRNVDISGIGQATDKEKAQIKQILESGFYA